MKRRPFGPRGTAVPVLGQGTWNMEIDPEGSIRALRRGLDLGMTHVDTASMYGDGRVEEIVGLAIEGRRQEVFLATKVVPEEASRRGTLGSCEKSLRRLQTDYLDLYLLHWIGPHPFAETVAAFEELKEKGKIREWGVSNFDETKLAEMLAVSGENAVACNQVLYHLKERSIEHAVIPYCVSRDVSVVAYSALGAGDFPAGDEPGRRALEEVGAEVGATARQVALAFLLEQVPFVLVKSSRIEHVEENAGAAEVVLTGDDRSRMEAAFPRGPRRAGIPML